MECLHDMATCEKNNIISSNNIWNFPIQRKSEPQGSTLPAAGQQRCKKCVFIFLQKCVANLVFQSLCQTAGRILLYTEKMECLHDMDTCKKNNITSSNNIWNNENQNLIPSFLTKMWLDLAGGLRHRGA